MLREKIATAYKDAMKAQDKARVGALRLINAALKDKDINSRVGGVGQVSDDEILQLLAKMIKQREESAKMYEDAGRAELAAQEKSEIVIIAEFMPQQMSENDVKNAINAIIGETGAASVKDMGKVIGLLKERYAGQMDFAKASGLVKAALSA